MPKFQENQRGAVPIIELLLLVAVIGVGGFVAYRYFNTPNSTIVVDVTPRPKTSTSPTPSPADTSKYLIVSQWNTKLPLVGHGLSYTMGAKTASFRSADLDKLSGTCTTNSVVISRGKANDTLLQEVDGSGSGDFKTSYDETMKAGNLGSNSRSIAVHIGDYYYVVPNFAGKSCVTVGYSEPGGKALADAESNAVLEIVKSVNAMTAQ